MIRLGERDGGQAAFARHPIGGGVGSNLAIPAKPQAVVVAHHIGQRHSHAARLWGLAQIEDAVGNQDDPAHAWLQSSRRRY
jgi:hypothetical protein